MNNDNTTLTTPPPPAFASGALVTLRSGGPTMVVKGIESDGTVECRWHARFGNHDSAQIGCFYAHELGVVDAEPSSVALQKVVIDQQTTITRLEEQVRRRDNLIHRGRLVVSGFEGVHYLVDECLRRDVKAWMDSSASPDVIYETTITQFKDLLRQQPTKPLTDTPSDAT